MRVRSLQTFLTSSDLVNTGSLDELKGLRIGVDAIYWLRTLPNLKDPLANAIGGLPPSVFGVLDTSLGLLAKQHINMLFVFQGIQPRSHMLFSSQLHQQMDEAWRLVSQGEYIAAQHRFAQATSRINSDFVHVVSHYLQSRNCEIFQAPYFSASQLAYFARENAIDAVFGPPALLLFGISKIITGINFYKKEFDWVDKEQLLSTWKVTEEQFVDACLLAGTEYCLTFPYLNLSQFHNGSAHFHFGTAINFIRQAPLVGYMQHFPNEEMRIDHVDGYCACKSLIKFPLAMHFNGKIRPIDLRKAPNKPDAKDTKNSKKAGALTRIEEPPASATSVGNTEEVVQGVNGSSRSAGPSGEASTLASKSAPAPSAESPVQLPTDFHKIVGVRLPDSLFFLMSRNFLGRKLPSVIALGEWWDVSHPTVDSVEYRDLLTEIQEYRRRAVGLIVMHLHPSLQEKPIKFSRYSCSPAGSSTNENPVTELLPDCKPGMRWTFSLGDLKAEMARQSVDRVSFRFCLNWHAHAVSQGKRLIGEPGTGEGPQIKLTQLGLAEAAVFFLLLENLGYFTPEGGVTVFGSALASTIPEFDEDVLFALELMKCGELMGEPLEPPTDRPFPPSMPLLKSDNPLHQRHILLLSRVVSLIPMRLNNTDLWLAPVDFDLAAYHSLVKTLKRTFRHLSEACLTSLLLKDIAATSVIPLSALDPRTGGFPSFMLPRNCLGIIFKHFLEFQDNKRHKDKEAVIGPNLSLHRKLTSLESELGRIYPCCVDPLGDLFRGIRFWSEIVRVIDMLSQNIDASVLKGDMDEANCFLLRRMAECGLHLHPTFQQSKDFAKLAEDIVPYVAAATPTSRSAASPSTVLAFSDKPVPTKPGTPGPDALKIAS